MEITENKNLKNFNTFKLDCIAREFYQIELKGELLELDFELDDFFILGGGSNIILPPKLDKKVIHFSQKGIKVDEIENGFLVSVSGAENWHQFVLYTVEKKLYGLENLALIPGNVGAAPVQNIGAYGVEQSDKFHSLEYYSFETKQFVRLNKKDCNFGYRDSIFKNKLKGRALITEVCYILDKLPNYKLDYVDLKNRFSSNKRHSQKDVFNAIVEIRNSKLPNPDIIPNTGSFFKNPVISTKNFLELKNNYPNMKYFQLDNSYKIPAAWLIESCGLKGFNLNGVGVYENHALVLCNLGSGTYTDLINLRNRIIDSVFDKFGIKLEQEVNVLAP